MNFAKYGVNIMTTGRMIFLGTLLAILMTGCSSESDQPGDAENSFEADRLEIAAILDETAVRWSYGDKAILYDQEFEYLRDENTYDEYLEIDRIKRMESDTVETFEVKNIVFFGRDSAHVSADVVFVGPTEDTTRLAQEWTMFFHRGRWIRPTLSSYAFQLDFEERVRQADSAADAEEEEDW